MSSCYDLGQDHVSFTCFLIWLLTYVPYSLQAGCKFLVFAHHQPMIDAIHEFLQVGNLDLVFLRGLFLIVIMIYLQKKKVGCIKIDGRTPSASRQALVTEFQENQDIKTAVVWFILKLNMLVFSLFPLSINLIICNFSVWPNVFLSLLYIDYAFF